MTIVWKYVEGIPTTFVSEHTKNPDKKKKVSREEMLDFLTFIL